VSWASTCPAAIAGLLAALGRSPALSGVTVNDGMGITDPDVAEVVSIGFSGSPDDEPAADAQVTREGAGLRNREQYRIACALAVTSGDAGAGALAAVRQRAFDLLGAAGDAISADPTLGRAVLGAWVSSWSLSPAQASNGVRAAIQFSVSIDAFTR
jgi:hypothetical protein